MTRHTSTNVAMDPQAIEAIEATLVEEVYAAQRRARLRLLGRLPVPVPSPDALALQRRRAGLARA